MRSRRRACAGLACVVLGLLAVPSSGSEPPDRNRILFVHVRPTQVDEDFDGSLPLVLSLELEKPDRLAAEHVPEAVLERAERRLVVRLGEGSTADPESPDRFLASTFLVDFDTDAIRNLIASRSDGSRPSVDEIVNWTRSVIEPGLGRGIDAASVVATTGRGDCTEFAVLFASLARSFGYPTVLELGMVIVASEDGDEIQSLGHAWTRVFVDGAWRHVDPTDIQGGRVLGYLRESVVLDEGPGFVFEWMRAYESGIESVRVLGPAAVPSPKSP